MIWSRLFAIGVLVCAVCAAVQDAATAQKITFGAMYNLTGGQQNLDIPSSEGARLAVDEINARGGVLGRPLDMILIDGETRPDVIERETAKLFEENAHVSALIGFSDTDMVLAAAPIAAKHRRIFMTSGATSPKLPAQVPEYLFLACFGDNVQAAAGAEWAFSDLKARTAIVLYNQGSTYTQLLQGYFQTRFHELGGKVLKTVPYTLEDFRNKIGDLPKADVIYLSALPDDVAKTVPALRDAGISTPVLGGDGLDIGEAWAEVPRANDIYFTTHAYVGADSPDPIVRRFRAAYEKSYPGREPDAFSALGYDTVGLLAHAIASADSPDPEAIRKALATTTGFKGVTGIISFVSGDRIPKKSVAIISIDGGRQKFVQSVLPDKIPQP